jgi:ribose transport system substrate-binding protein
MEREGDMKRKALLVLGIVIVLLFCAEFVAAQALSQFTTFGEFKKAPPYKIGFAFHGGGIDFDIQCLDAFKYFAEKEYGFLISKLYVSEAQFDTNKQIADIEDMMAKGIDGLLISPTTPTALIPTLDALYAKKFPVVVCLTQYDGHKYAAQRTTDGVKFGTAGAEWLVEQLKKKYGTPKGNLIVLRGVQGAGADVARWDRGAKPVFDKYPQIKIVGMGEGKWAYDEARRVAATLLAANPKIDGVWSCGGQMSLAAGEIMVEKKMPLVPISGEDYNGFFKFWINHKKDGFSSVSPTFPNWIASQGLQALMNVLLGEMVVRDVNFDPPTITDATVEKFVKNSLPDTIWVATSMSEDVLKTMYVR